MQPADRRQLRISLSKITRILSTIPALKKTWKATISIRSPNLFPSFFLLSLTSRLVAEKTRENERENTIFIIIILIIFLHSFIFKEVYCFNGLRDRDQEWKTFFFFSFPFFSNQTEDDTFHFPFPIRTHHLFIFLSLFLATKHNYLLEALNNANTSNIFVFHFLLFS